MSKSSIFRYILIILIAPALLAVVLTLSMLFLKPQSAQASHGLENHIFLSLAVTPTTPLTVNSTTQPDSFSSFINTPFIIAIIGVIGMVLGAVATGIITYHYQKKYKKQEELQKAQIAQQEGQNREVQQREAAKTFQEHIEIYRSRLKDDAGIAYLQILDTSRSLPVERIYVRLRLHQETRFKYTDNQNLPDNLSDVQPLRDPNKLFQVKIMLSKVRYSEALEPNEAIARYKHCVILGDPGAGKTTLLKNLAMKSVQTKLKALPDLPLYVQLNAFARSPYNDLLEFVDSLWVDQYSFCDGEVQSNLKDELKKGKVLVLLDGLDETYIGEKQDEARRTYERVFREVLRFRNRFDASPMVVTVRKAAYLDSGMLEKFTELEVVDFRPEDIQQFVNNWFDYKEEHQSAKNLNKTARDLNNRIEKNSHIKALAANPLLLTLITIVYEADLKLPGRRAALYKRCVETLVSRWDNQRRIQRPQELTPEKLNILLEEIAWHFHRQRLNYFNEDELLDVIEGILPVIHLPKNQKSQVLKEITSTNGLLKEQAKEWYGFLHPTFQDFFVAQRAGKQDLSDLLLSHCGESWWEEAIMLSAAYTFDASPFLKKIFQKNDEIPFEENIFHEELILAGQYAALANAIRQPELSDEIIKRLKNVLVKTPYSLTREQILTVLIEMDKQEENDYLLGLLSDQTIKKDVQECIVNALRDDLKLPQHKAVVSELGLLLTKPEVDNDIRKYIVIKLGEQGDHSQIPLLLDMLANPNVDADVRCSIADTLRIPGSKHVISPLLNILKEAGDWNVRTHIVDALSSLGDDSLASSLRPLLTNPHMSIDEHVRIHLIDALGRLNDYSGVSQLLQMLLDPKTEQQERIHLISNVGKLIMGLDELEKRQIMANLASQLENDPEKYLCISLLLYQLGDYSRVNNLTQCLSSVSIGLSLRLYIASELVKSGNKLIYHQLFELLTQPLIETSIKKGIIDTVGSLGDAAMASALEPFMANSDIDLEIQAHIVNTLMLLGETSVVAKGLALLSNEAIEVQLRQQIADNLSIFGQHVQVEDLLQRLANRHIDKSVRRHIASTLGQLAGDESSVSALEKLLQTSDIKDDIHRALWEVKNRVNRRNGK